MKNASKRTPKKALLLVTRSDSEIQGSAKEITGDRSIATRLGKAAVEYVRLAPETLERELTDFLKTMETVLNKIPASVADLSIDSIEISVEITAKGAVGLLGTGGEVGGTGGLKFTLKRA